MIKVIIFLFAGVAVASALVCEPDFCDRIRCKVTTCPPGQVRTKKNNCQCCGICVPLQKKGEYCLPDYPLKDYTGRVIQDSDCASGLKCDSNTRKCVEP
ncbi:hypothetical protein AVEN_249687-1 [Araneus ventricosus]|uniref:IGFBP N-terminal domain-containing protein n=1 Tax=Araneus ventricosus TaxID=182803 RepID=A0A4Y2F789_ARAVE|nr:hypothetical protein AVEN_249687-1 [Araneus ventricosus]